MERHSNSIKLKGNIGSNIKEIKTKEGSRLNDPVQIANNFNKYFNNVANEITKKFHYLQNPLLTI